MRISCFLFIFFNLSVNNKHHTYFFSHSIDANTLCPQEAGLSDKADLQELLALGGTSVFTLLLKVCFLSIASNRTDTTLEPREMSQGEKTIISGRGKCEKQKTALLVPRNNIAAWKGGINYHWKCFFCVWMITNPMATSAQKKWGFDSGRGKRVKGRGCGNERGCDISFVSPSVPAGWSNATMSLAGR